MKWTVRNWLLCAATVLAAAAAVILPPRLSALADGRLADASYAVQVENMDISLVYQLSTAERLSLLSRMSEEDVLTFSDMQPAQDELTLDRAAAVCQEELDTLYRLGGLPAPFTVQSLENSAYLVICDRDSPQRSLSLWMLNLSAGKGNAYNSADVFMDAETGLIYALNIPYIDIQGTPVSTGEILTCWGEYLSLGLPVMEQPSLEFPQFLESIRSEYVEIAVSPYTVQAEYPTDEGTTVEYAIRLSAGGNARGKEGTWISLALSPFPFF